MKPLLSSCVILAVLALAPAAGAQALAPVFEARADGVPVVLHGFLQGDFGLFELRGPVEIEIKAPFDVRWADVRPRSSGIVPFVESDHRTVRFHMAAPLPVTIEFNDDLAKVLHLFAYAPEKGPPSPGSPGVLYFGPGEHEAGRIDLKDGQTLYLAPGAWVKGFVRSVGAKGVAVRGRGVLDGSGFKEDAEAGGAPSAAPARSEAKGWSSKERADAYGMGRRNMVYLQGTDGATLEGITIFNSPGWTVCVRDTRGTRIDAIRILNPSVNYGDDGIDIVSSTDMRVEDSFVRTNDDCIAVKNLDDVETHGISVRRCVLWNMPTGGNALEIGFETGHTRISRIKFEDIDIIHVQRGSAISIHNGDAATVEDVAYRNIRVEDVRRKLVDFGIVYAQYGFDRPPTEEERVRRMDAGGVWDGEERTTPAEAAALARNRGHIRNVTITDLAVVEGDLPYSVIAGFDRDHSVEGVSVSGLTYLGRPVLNAADGKFAIENAPGFEMK